MATITLPALERLYATYNRRCYVHPDPLEFLYEYDDCDDREVVGLIAAGLAYGRVAQILRSVAQVLAALGPHPAHAVDTTPEKTFRNIFRSFKHRFTTGEEIAALLSRVAAVRQQWGSLQACLTANTTKTDSSYLPALISFSKALRGSRSSTSLVPAPEKGSAGKRLHLYLRWMVRHDAVDPGCWHTLSPSKLLVPLDTHMHTICRRLGFTKRRSADIRTAIEITAAFRALCPEDPVRFDFSLTRLGIRTDTDMAAAIAELFAGSQKKATPAP